MRLAYVLLVRPILFPNLSLFFGIVHFEHPSVLSRFCLWQTCRLNDYLDKPNALQWSYLKKWCFLSFHSYVWRLFDSVTAERFHTVSRTLSAVVFGGIAMPQSDLCSFLFRSKISCWNVLYGGICRSTYSYLRLFLFMQEQIVWFGRCVWRCLSFYIVRSMFFFFLQEHRL